MVTGPGSTLVHAALLLAGILAGGAVGLLFTGWRRRKERESQRRSLAAVESANSGLQAALASLEEAAGTDRLTGAWNRRRFEEAAYAEMSLARRRREPVTLLMLDLDRFKKVNDSFGHETGDAVLAGAAHAWKGVLRASDPLVRWGGEEFLVLSPLNRMEGAVVLGHKLQEALRSLRFPGLPAQTVSIGVAEYTPGESLESWLQRADQALYRAKAEGRDRVVAAAGPSEETLVMAPVLEMQWEEAYACGNTLIDQQHQHAFELVNGVLAALSMRLPREEVLLRWNRLLAHVAQHFHDEERLLAKAGFPDLAQHADEHQRLLASALALQARFLEGQEGSLQLAHDFIHDLVAGHLLKEDKAYATALLALR